MSPPSLARDNPHVAHHNMLSEEDVTIPYVRETLDPIAEDDLPPIGCYPPILARGQ